MRGAVVFAGPSIFGIDRALLVHVDLRPPAGRGDILFAAAEGARAIGLIDGLFDSEPADVYVDSCCHYTGRGATLFTQFVVEQIERRIR